MGPADRSQVDELRRQAGALGHGAARTALLEEAVRLADLSGDVELGFDSRAELMEAAIFSGAPEKAMVALSWNLAQLDRRAVDRPEFQTLWNYKNIIKKIHVFPQVGRDQVVGALADFERRVERSGLGMRPMLKLRYSTAWEMGDFDEAHAAYALAAVATGPSQRLPDLRPPQRSLVPGGNPQRRGGSDSCGPHPGGEDARAVVPQATLAMLLLPLVRLGRVPEAMRHHRRGYRMIAHNPYFLERVGQHIQFLALTNNLPRGVKLFATHLPWALGTFDLSDRFHFALGVAFLFDRLQAAGTASLRLRLPASFDGYQASGSYQVAALASWVASDAAELARRFDARNGNDAFSRRIEANRELAAFVTPFPLKSTGEGDAGAVS